MSRSLKELMDLSGRVALVTGGGGYVGTEAATALAELGADIAVVDIDKAKSAITAENLVAEHGVKSVAMPLDLADEKALKALPRKVVKEFGRLDIIVNAAAFVGTSDLKGWAVPFAEQSVETWRAALGSLICGLAATLLELTAMGTFRYLVTGTMVWVRCLIAARL